MSLRDDFKIKKMSYSVALSLKGRLEKDGKKSDIVQKGGGVSEKNQILNV